MIESDVLALLKSRRLTLSAAESCTGGLIAKRITDLPGASAVFPGSVVSYCDAVKSAALGVPEDLLTRYGAVSEPVARAMAEGVRRFAHSDLALSVTGVAGPDRDERDNPVGLVYIGLATPNGTRVETYRFSGDRRAIRTAAADGAFTLLRQYLTEEDV
ncbi:MAG: nicotinamide-nucleotide amidohydrolase family protein [Oscillospiraceae bacterium]|nr:nicotinamide-nucleotide amidohydrolase family protein [Oscillospiraceae bacterium]